MKRLRPFVVIGFAVIVGGAVLSPGTQAAAGATIAVDSTADTDARDGVLTLREAISLATGVLAISALDSGECGQVSASTYGPPCSTSATIGAASADSIRFDGGVFPSASPTTIALSADLPQLNTGNDSIDGTGAGVIVSGATTCIHVRSTGNTIKAIRVNGCGEGIYVESTSAGITGNRIIGVTLTQNTTGIQVEGQANEVIGSFIGTDAAGQTGLGNNIGVDLEMGSATRIGGPHPSDRNVISGNGVGVFSGSGGSYVIENNFIGTDATGGNALPNTTDGIRTVSENPNNFLIKENVISGNGTHGLNIGEGGGHTIVGNLIGTDATGTAALANGGDGIRDYSRGEMVIGGTAPSDRNVISGNGLNGIETTSFWGHNTIKGNFIGVAANGTSLIGNQGDGIRLSDSRSNAIGGLGPGEANVVAGNGSNGVKIIGFDAEENTVRGNSIFSNSLKGIENATGGNHELAPPIVDSVAGSVSGHTSPKCYPCTVDVYSDSEDEGRVYHGSAATNDDATGTWVYAGPVSGPNISAIITDASGNTSEFSAAAALADVDEDGVPDWTDNCPTVPNADQTDYDADLLGDACDPDDDGDGIGDAPDACFLTREDLDGFQDGDGCPEADNDMDGVCDPWATPALPVCTGSDNCPNVPEDADAFRDTDGCPDPDNDGDFFPDFTDQCPGTDASTGEDGIPCTADPNEVNTCEDYDGIIDTDGCHDSPGDDFDGDSLGSVNQQGFPIFWDEVEVYLGTDPSDACPDGPSDDAWPLDINMDTYVTVPGDVLNFAGRLGAAPGSPNWWQRLDFNGDGVITIPGDALKYAGKLGAECT